MAAEAKKISQQSFESRSQEELFSILGDIEKQIIVSLSNSAVGRTRHNQGSTIDVEDAIFINIRVRIIRQISIDIQCAPCINLIR